MSDRRSRNKISMRNYDQVVCNIGCSYIFIDCVSLAFVVPYMADI